MPRYKIPLKLVYRSDIETADLIADSPEAALEQIKESVRQPWDLEELELDLELSEFGTPQEVQSTPLTPERRELAAHFAQSIATALTKRDGDTN